MDYSRFKPEDFSRDPSFQKWVLTDDPETAASWKAWLKQHPEKYDDIAKAREAIRLLGFQNSHAANEDFLEVWNGIAQDIREVPEKLSHRATVPSGRSYRKSALKIAAVFTGIMVSGLLAFMLLRSEPLTVYTTEFGKTRSVSLPDGSTVTLNANSTMYVAKSWDGEGPREVWLEGEAFFEVQEVFRHETNTNETTAPRPVKFIVYTGHVDVEVLGTEFNVNNRHSETRVVLKSGKVKLSINDGDKTDEIYMVPGEMVAFNGLNKELVKKTVNPEVHASWKDHKLMFEEATLRQVAMTLEDLYGIKIRFEEPALADELFTGLIPYDDIDIIIEAFTKLYAIKITKYENTIIFHKK